MRRLDARQGGWAVIACVCLLAGVGVAVGTTAGGGETARGPDEWALEEGGDEFALEADYSLEQAPRLPVPEAAVNARLVRETVAAADGGSAPDPALAQALAASQAKLSDPRVTAAAPLPIPSGATHVFPVLGGARYSNDWGAPRATTGRHQGIDLFSEAGTPLVAVADGVVFKVGWNRVGGWRLWLRDRYGIEYYYAHLMAYSPVPYDGVTVKAGTVLGYMGTSGDARGTPPHVHFEVHPGGGAAVPPLPYVSRWPWLSPRA